MRIARKVITALVIAMLLTTAVFAAQSGRVWVSVERTEGTSALIVTDAVVTDGVLKLTYDSEMLTYEGIEVFETCVAMYAVNAEEPGTVLISWVAPGSYSLENGAVCLFRVNFSGAEEESSLTVSGTVHGLDGASLDIVGAPDTAGLADAIADARALDEKAYTTQSWSALAAALADAQAVMQDATATQAEVDAAEKALRDAMAELVKVPGTTEDPTESTATQATEDPSESTTKATESSGDNADTGDDSNIWLFVVIIVASAAAIVVLLIKMKKGGDAK